MVLGLFFESWINVVFMNIGINKLYNENCLDTMARMPDNFIDLTVTSPPYDNQRDYKDDVGKQWSFETSKPIIKGLFRVSKDGGVVVWVVNDATIDGSETGTSFRQALYFMECGFKLHDTMIWHKTSIPKTHNRYEQSFEYMFVFVKGKSRTFNPILDIVKNVGNKHTRGHKEITAKSEGRSASAGIYKSAGYAYKDTKIHDNIFYYSVGHNQTSKDSIAFKHPAPFPEQLAADHIKSWSDEGDLIYDPFGGSGTTAKMARLLKRNWIASEISREYCEIHKQRLEFNDLFN